MQYHRHLLLLLYPYVAGGVALEIICFLFVRKRNYPWSEMFTSIGVFLVRLPAKLLGPVIVLPVSYFVWSHRLMTIPYNTAWGLALLFLGTQLAYYWSHRAGHEIRWIWATHVVHHTPEQIHLASAFRLSPTEVLSGQWLFHMPLTWWGSTRSPWGP
jgi:sterol desaturase/sphingolipid hydroxylase (fatty acid hydroxylase superfamily)